MCGQTGRNHWGLRQTHDPGLQRREIEPQNLRLKTPVGVEAVGETPSLTGELVGETHRVLECTQTHTPENQNQEGPICLGGGED